METLQFNRNRQDIVRTDGVYTYERLKSDINELKMVYPFLEIGNIGRSVLGRTIPYVRIRIWPKRSFL